MNSESGNGRNQLNLDRVELIERLKRTKSPIWQQGQDVRHPLLYATILEFRCLGMLQLLIQHRSSAARTVVQHHDPIREIDQQALC
jgi:hypothetical protein